MRKHKTGAEYIALFEELAKNRKQASCHLARVKEAADSALRSGDPEAFFALSSFFSAKEDLKLMSSSQELMRLRFLITAVENEADAGFPLFISDVQSFDELMTRYTFLTLLLRRIEFDVAPFDAEAYETIRSEHFSPYAVSAVLYNMVSVLGHREEILLKLASDALACGAVKEAYGFLSVVENPGEETKALMAELAGAMEGAGG